jgi:hypothetical protein
MIPYETLLDAARRHFERVADAPNFTHEARHKALELAREAAAELDAYNRGEPVRELIELFWAGRSGAAWDAEPEPLRPAA